MIFSLFTLVPVRTQYTGYDTWVVCRVPLTEYMYVNYDMAPLYLYPVKFRFRFVQYEYRTVYPVLLTIFVVKSWEEAKFISRNPYYVQ